MAHRRIGHERLGFAASRAAGSSLDELAGLIDWQPLAALVKPIHASAKGEAVATGRPWGRTHITSEPALSFASDPCR
jgi:hypothetical protein